MTRIPKIPTVPDEARTPLVASLLEITKLQQEYIQVLKDEIAILKGLKAKPKIKPSKLGKGSNEKNNDKEDKNKSSESANSGKREKIKVHETVIVPAPDVPPGSRFRGYEDYTVQGLVIKVHTICYRRERWETPQGDRIVAPLPEDVQAVGGHFNCTLICFILYQYHHAGVTEPLIWEQLQEWGIKISTGQISRIITENKELFHAEKDEILRVGLEISKYIHVDDTGARHQGNNGYCTHIGNELFAWFQSTDSKSRINFLELLRAGNKDYVINEEALNYINTLKLAKPLMAKLCANEDQVFEDRDKWMAALKSWGITDDRHVRIATEGALLGSIIEHGFNPKLIILSDDAGQFNILLHALCWIHAERTIRKLVGFTEEHREALEEVRGQIWDFYEILKGYKQAPSEAKKREIQERFDEIFAQQTCYTMLNLALKRLHKNKDELLLVLDYPFIPLQNNPSENDIREYVKKRKISGSTRSPNGRKNRDTFTSLKKTGRKLLVPFWKYLNDRISKRNEIPPLSELIRLAAARLHPT